jgi:hypothetical protein
VCKDGSKNLNDDQKARRNEVSVEMLERLETESDFLNRVITGDESWFSEYGPETKRQSEEWHTPQSPRQKKARMSKSKLKTMVIIFFDCLSVVHKEFVSPGVTVNQKYYLVVLDRLRKRVMRVRMEIAAHWILRVSSRQRAHAYRIVSL